MMGIWKRQKTTFGSGGNIRGHGFRQSFLSSAYHAVLLLFLIIPPLLPLRKMEAEGSVPSAHECADLFRHQLDVASKDPENPLADALSRHRGGIEDSATTESQVSLCLNQYTPDLVQCQNAAESMRGLLDCMAKYPLRSLDKAEGSSGAAGSSPEKQVDQGKGASGKKETPPVAGQKPSGEGAPPQGDIIAAPIAVDTESCGLAYNHLLGVYSHYPTLEKSPDRQRLLDYWQSAEARTSFEKRCTSRFKLSDLSCILSTNDPDRIQGCLIQIPEE